MHKFRNKTLIRLMKGLPFFFSFKFFILLFSFWAFYFAILIFMKYSAFSL